MNYWFRCTSCPWRGIRFHNQRKCPACGAPVHRERQATKAEQARAFEDALARYRAIPD
jgi:rRNA maturation endonuclease Nob1